MKTLQSLSLAVFCAILIAFGFILYRGQKKYQMQSERLVQTGIDGRISSLRPLGRGSHEFAVIRDSHSDTLKFSCNCTFEVKKYSISAGDSISKPPRSNVLSIYQNRRGVIRVMKLPCN